MPSFSSNNDSQLESHGTAGQPTVGFEVVSKWIVAIFDEILPQIQKYTVVACVDLFF